MVIKNLCTRHNSDLSEVDTEAKRLLDGLLDMNRQVTALKNGERRPRRVIELDAAKLERWMFKTTYNFSLQAGNNRPGLFSAGEPDHTLIQIAYGQSQFNEPHGLYWNIRTGDKVAGSDLGRMQWRSLIDPTGKVVAAEFLFHGFWLWLMLPGSTPFAELNRGESIEHTEAGFEIRCIWSKQRIKERRRQAAARQHGAS